MARQVNHIGFVDTDGNHKRGVMPVARTIVDRYLADRKINDAMDVVHAVIELLIESQADTRRPALIEQHIARLTEATAKAPAAARRGAKETTTR